MRTIFTSILCALFLMMGATVTWSQGSTSSRINGQVVSNGESLIGAAVIATHTPTGFEYGTTTNLEGYFTLNNVNVGGPYEIVVSFLGYEDLVINDVFLGLGQTETFNLELRTSSVTLDEVVVTSGGLFDGNRTGSETKVSEDLIASLPTADRGLNDYLRVTPQADVANNGQVNGGGISFTGVNNRFNSIFIDGAVNNDVFGLANSGTNGGQAGISPISPDAIEQIQIVLAPYDVTLGGFAGGGINAVTRSGTNELEGSAYYFFRNENLAGRTPTDTEGAERTRLAPFTAQTFGARLGGPLIKNKLFFFANAEIQRDEEPRPFVPEDYIGDATIADIEAVAQKLRDDFGYEPGEFLNNNQTTDGEKFLVKLDWNINAKHKLTARHSYVKGTTEIHPAPSESRAVFTNVGYIFPSTTNSTAVELKSLLGPNVSNNLILGLTTVRDDRDILGDPFPQIELNDGNGRITIGTDNFSHSNIVNQDVFTITNNFNLFKGKHNWTFGTHNEFFTIENLFTIFSTPEYTYFFDGVNRFLNDELPDLVLFGHEQSVDGSPIRIGDAAENLGPSFDAAQLAFYGQDEIQINPDFKLTLGLRLDIPIFTDDPPLDNVQFNNETIPILENAGWDLQGARASQTPSTQLLWSPRVGFNYDLHGDKTTQLRGGVGIFTSRVPWVWPGGQFIRNGLNSAFTVSGDVPIYTTEEEWLANLTSDASPTGDVDLFAEDFKYPQILRASLALDKKLAKGWNATGEFTYTKTINNQLVQSINVSPDPIGTLGGADNRPVFNFDELLDPTYQNITLVSNTSEGFTWNFTAQLSKSFKSGTYFNAAYSFTDAEAVVDGRGFINNTNWQNILSVQGNNNAIRTKSTFAAGSRITAFLSHQFNWIPSAPTSISLFYTGKSGSPFSYVYNNEISDVAQESGVSDLIFVPASAADINLVDNGTETAAEQWAALDAFIENDSYLSTRRGQFAEANESRTPFEHVVDVKLSQDFFFNGHQFQFTFDIFNFTNLLNSSWGRRYFIGGNTFSLIQSNRPEASLDSEVEFNFSDPGDPSSIVQSGTYSARWVGQVGLRYIFGGGTGAKDTDGDGVRDKKDSCPLIAGSKDFDGCPDSDGDGIIDSLDDCPVNPGLVENNGCPDSDSDGVLDKNDGCPNEAGTLNGCPDSDGDGVADKDDRCPNAAGTLNGCPDSDGDGIVDSNDNCPNVAGTLRGCPDSDGDGVADKDDDCPNVAGDAANGCASDSDGDGVNDDRDACPNVAGDVNGCPDSDGDGVVDKDDKCPNIGGVVGPDGCARTVPASATEVFRRAISGINFNSGSNVITSESYAILDEVVSVMNQYPQLNVSIEGHTDSQGNDQKNLDLSSRRAQAVQSFLMEKGISASRLRSVGYGETTPIATNDTSAGRAQNRRVELKGSY